MASPKKENKVKKPKAKKEKKPKAEGEETKRRRKGKRSFKRFIARVNKATNKNTDMSKRAVKILDSFANDIFDRLAAASATICRNANSKTLTSAAVQTAVRTMLPGDLAKHSISEASKACTAAGKGPKAPKAKKEGGKKKAKKV